MGNTLSWKDVCDQIAKETAQVQKEVMKKVTKEMKEKGKEPSMEYIQKLATEETKKFQKQNEVLFEKIWQKYDTDKSGFLDEKETKELLKESLAGQKEYLPVQVESMFAATVEAGLDMAKDMGASKKEIEEARKILTGQVKALKEKALKTLSEMLDGLIKDSDKHAAELFKKMDSNGDGKISKEEFTKNYQKASAELINIQQMLGMMQQTLADG